MSGKENNQKRQVRYRALKKIFIGGVLLGPGEVFTADAGLVSANGGFELLRGPVGKSAPSSGDETSP